MSTDTAFTNTLDLCDLAPLKRQQLVFSHFENLQPGQWFQISTDQDPKALYEQLQTRSGGSVTWEVLAKGPTWRVQLGKRVVESGGCCSGGACHG